MRHFIPFSGVFQSKMQDGIGGRFHRWLNVTILISDHVSSDKAAIHPAAHVRALHDHGIVVHTVGWGDVSSKND